MKVVTVRWEARDDRFVAAGTHLGQEVVVNAPHETGGPTGFSASELLLASAGSCSAWDVLEIVRKRRHEVRDLRVTVRGEQAADYPRAFTRIELTYHVSGPRLDRTAIERAVRLSVERYCPVIATLRGVAEIVTAVELGDVERTAGAAEEQLAGTPNSS